MLDRKFTFGVFFVSMSLSSGCSDALWGCGETLSEAGFSPDKTKVIVWKARNCGATTTHVYSVYVLPVNKYKKIDASNIKISKKYRGFQFVRGYLKAEWTSDKSINVLYDFPLEYGRTGEFYTQNNNVFETEITYTQTGKAFIRKE